MGGQERVELHGDMEPREGGLRETSIMKREEPGASSLLTSKDS